MVNHDRTHRHLRVVYIVLLTDCQHAVNRSITKKAVIFFSLSYCFRCNSANCSCWKRLVSFLLMNFHRKKDF